MKNTFREALEQTRKESIEKGRGLGLTRGESILAAVAFEQMLVHKLKGFAWGLAIGWLLAWWLV